MNRNCPLRSNNMKKIKHDISFLSALVSTEMSLTFCICRLLVKIAHPVIILFSQTDKIFQRTVLCKVLCLTFLKLMVTAYHVKHSNSLLSVVWKCQSPVIQMRCVMNSTWLSFIWVHKGKRESDRLTNMFYFSISHWMNNIITLLCQLLIKNVACGCKTLLELLLAIWNNESHPKQTTTTTTVN